MDPRRERQQTIKQAFVSAVESRLERAEGLAAKKDVLAHLSRLVDAKSRSALDVPAVKAIIHAMNDLSTLDGSESSYTETSLDDWMIDQPPSAGEEQAEADTAVDGDRALACVADASDGVSQAPTGASVGDRNVAPVIYPVVEYVGSEPLAGNGISPTALGEALLRNFNAAQVGVPREPSLPLQVRDAILAYDWGTRDQLARQPENA